MASSSKIKSYSFTNEAYALAVYHTLKHSNCQVSGFLLGRVDGTSVSFERAVPFSHSHALAPTLKLACVAAEALGKSEDGKQLELLGYYCGNELADAKKELKPIHRNVFERFVQNNPAASAWLIDTEKLDDDVFALKGFTAKDRAGELVPIPASSIRLGGASLGGDRPGLLMEETKNLEYLQVSDFDDHLHDPSKDWTNAELHGILATKNWAGA
ncbi:unnamed protein product [Amoebophrya sp. A25]|nr:unnamed protein product [Amoebophrya sp. A25]|eukprot:GSA25T00001286001.1